MVMAMRETPKPGGIHHAAVGLFIDEEDEQAHAKGKHNGQDHIQHCDAGHIFQKFDLKISLKVIKVTPVLFLFLTAPDPVLSSAESPRPHIWKTRPPAGFPAAPDPGSSPAEIIVFHLQQDAVSRWKHGKGLFQQIGPKRRRVKTPGPACDPHVPRRGTQRAPRR